MAPALESTVTIDVWYDGECELCRRSKRWSERRDRAGRVRFRDLRTEPEAARPRPLADLERTMWVCEPGAEPRAGFDGWRRILAELPGWRWLARLTAIPPLPAIGRRLYDLIARNRHRLPLAPACDDACHLRD